VEELEAISIERKLTTRCGMGFLDSALARNAVARGLKSTRYPLPFRRVLSTEGVVARDGFQDRTMYETLKSFISRSDMVG